VTGEITVIKGLGRVIMRTVRHYFSYSPSWFQDRVNLCCYFRSQLQRCEYLRRFSAFIIIKLAAFNRTWKWL